MCLLGQIVSFTETLHLTYDEVVYRIPYRTLAVMQRDKLRVCYGEKMIEVTDEEMFGKGAFLKKGERPSGKGK